MRTLIFLLCICISTNSFSQAPKASINEICWAIVHPFAALKVKKLTRQANLVVDTKHLRAELDSFSDGGKADAFRHVFYMSVYSQVIKVKKLRKLGIAHEKTNFKQFKKGKSEFGGLPDSLSSVMDLTNNELGFLLGSENKNLAHHDLYLKVISEIKAGKAMIMLRNKNGSFLNCDYQPLNLRVYAKQWHVPKCLVASAYTYVD